MSTIKNLSGFISKDLPELHKLAADTVELGSAVKKRSELMIGSVKADLEKVNSDLDELEHFLNVAEGNGPPVGRDVGVVDNATPATDENR